MPGTFIPKFFALRYRWVFIYILPPFENGLICEAKRLNIPLYQGVYLSTLGPSFETPAEIRAFKQWGADAVGM